MFPFINNIYFNPTIIKIYIVLNFIIKICYKVSIRYTFSIDFQILSGSWTEDTVHVRFLK